MRPTFKLVPDFILPNLENATYGRHLKWEDKRRGSFKVSRIHQNSEHWSDDCISVYKAWSLKKRLWKLDDPKRVTKAKHRLITALRRNPIVEVLKKEPAYYRFRLTDFKSSEKQGMHSLIDIDQNVPNSSSWTKETDALVEKLEENKSENCDGCLPTAYGKQLTGNLCVDHAEKDTEKSISSEISCTIVYEIESDNAFQSSFSACEVSSENSYFSGNDSGSSGKCCCKVLLDSTLLCNEMCIWHGVSS